MKGEKLPKLDVEYLGTAPVTDSKPMIVEFWATWCPPCRASIPHLNDIFAKYKDKGLVIIGITKEEKSVVKGFLKKTPMNYFPALDAKGKYSAQFKIKGIPHAVVVDKSGTVVWEGHPMQLNDKIIESILK